MSLSAWLRDYLYIPLGGNRKGEARTYLNLFLVMFLGGLWHGAEWKFAFWGTLHGILLGIERFCFRKRLVESSVIPKPAWRSILGWVYTFHAVTLLWLTFLMPDLHQIGIFFTELTIPGKLLGSSAFSTLLFGSAVVIYHGFGWWREHRSQSFSCLRSSWSEACAYGVMLFLIITNSGAPQGFIYFQF